MEEAEFDRFADEYESMHARNVAISGESPDFFAEYKVRDLAGLLRARAHDELSIVDFGAGIGSSVPHFRRHLPRAHVTCLDVSHKSLALGRQRHGDAARFEHFDGASIPCDDASVDVVFAACVFHHIESDQHVPLLREFRRVLRAQGLAVVFEHNPLNPLTRRAVDTCPFDENAVLIRASEMVDRFRRAGFSQPQRRFRIFFPHALRWLRRLEPSMVGIPVGAQYYVVGTGSQ